MRSIKSLLQRSAAIIISTAITGTVSAQDAPATTKTISSSSNQLEILMIIVALLLAFVIWGLGQVLLTLGKQALDKNKQGKIFSVTLLIGLSLLSTTGHAQTTAAADIVNVTPNYGGMSSTGFWMMATVLATELLVIWFMMFSIRRIQAELLPKTDKVKMMALKEWWSRLDKKIFTKAVAVEKEADVMLDHDYDGIKELDNALPPWWKYGFYITIAVAFVYMLNFHVFGYGQNPTEEYLEEIAKAQEAKEIYDAKNADKVNEANLQMPGADGISAGKEVFTTVCWACHGKQGEGGAGPNLTDNYWIHKGSLTDIYQSIKHGYPDKGMQSWEKNYSPKQILELSGFIKSLKGTNPPNPKDPQGDLFNEAANIDSVTVKPMVDSVLLKKPNRNI